MFSSAEFIHSFIHSFISLFCPFILCDLAISSYSSGSNFLWLRAVILSIVDNIYHCSLTSPSRANSITIQTGGSELMPRSFMMCGWSNCFRISIIQLNDKTWEKPYIVFLPYISYYWKHWMDHIVNKVPPKLVLHLPKTKLLNQYPITLIINKL